MIARLAVLAALLASPALAQPPGPPGGGPPGGPSDEPPRRPQLFISPAGEPFRAPRDQPYPVAAWFTRADANHDGVIDREEFLADALAFNARLDTDRDGFIDGFEVADYEKNVAPEILSPLDRGDESPRSVVADVGRKPFIGLPRAVDRGVAYGSSRNGAGLYGLINEVQPVMAQDSDLDRRIDVKEVGIAARDRFAILDRDKDGKLTLATLPKTPFQTILEAPPPKDAGKRRGRPPGP
jgi:Ca2+-binding EF-hand superfamily protein